MVDDRQPREVYRLDLLEQTQTHPQRPVDDRGEVRHPAPAKCHGRAEQAEYPQDAAVRHHRLHHQKDAQRPDFGGLARVGNASARRPRLFPAACGRLFKFFDPPVQSRDCPTEPLLGFSAHPEFVGAGDRLVFPPVTASYEF